MNLIEKYGSYDAARAKQQELSKIAADPQILLVGKIIREIGEIEMALLEYRRQHNIYEESDKIVFIDDFMHVELMTVAWTRKGEVWMDGGAKRCTDLSMIRHATDEEIKAGKRL